MERRNVKRFAVALAVAASGVAAATGLVLANGTGGHGLTRVDESSVQVADRIRMNEKPGAQVITYHITVEPGGHAPWHYHPGPHLVSVRSGTVRVYETDCSYKAYPAGTGFYDPGPTNRPHVHTLSNPSSEPAEIVVTDVRSDDLRPAVVVDPQPAPCFS